MRPKAIGAWNTDATSRGLPALEHFIFFSSVVAAQGNAGMHVCYEILVQHV